MATFSIRPKRHHATIVAVIFVFVTIISLVVITEKPAVESSKKLPAPAKAKQPQKQAVPQQVAPPVVQPDYVLPPIQNGMAPVVSTVSTKEKVVFLGIDDGAFKDPSVIDIMKQNNIKASLFLSRAFIANNPSFFTQLEALGSVIEDHTLGHDTRMVWDQGYQQQKNEICGMADYEEQQYGKRPTLFRPPGGSYSNTLRKAAADCGMKAVVTWIAKANGGSMQYQVGNKLRAGDVVLMHFRPEFKQDMKAFVDAMNVAGLHTALLEDALT
jgi:peptidoglycan/xylan/chitin deacetylase (PgdA/CDA1 family)